MHQAAEVPDFWGAVAVSIVGMGLLEFAKWSRRKSCLGDICFFVGLFFVMTGFLAVSSAIVNGSSPIH